MHNTLVEKMKQVRSGSICAISELARFPSENPAPVLRVCIDGTVLYSNKAGEQILDLW